MIKLLQFHLNFMSTAFICFSLAVGLTTVTASGIPQKEHLQFDHPQSPQSASPDLELSTSSVLSVSCNNAIDRMSSLSVSHPELMARYWDSWGKPSHGIMEGHTTFLGYYDECIDLKDTLLGKMDYCLYAFQMNTTTGVFQGVAKIVQIGVCYPSACTAQEFAAVLSTVDTTTVTTLMGNPYSVNSSTLSVELNSVGRNPLFCPTTDPDYDAATVLTLIVCGVLIGLVIVGTAADILTWMLASNEKELIQVDVSTGSLQAQDKEDSQSSGKDVLLPPPVGNQSNHDRPKPMEFILAFSIYKNVPNLLSTKYLQTPIKVAGSIKVIVMLWLILAHLYDVLTYYPLIIENPLFLFVDLPSRFAFQPFISATHAWNSFLLLSALLTSYITFKDMEKHDGRFRVLYFYIHRFLTTSPLYYLVVFFSFKVFVHLASGPLWWYLEYHGCEKHWWADLIYAINFIPDSAEWCMGITWYLAVETQLYIISPIFIVLLYKAWYVGLATIGIAMAGSITVVGILAGRNHYHAQPYAHPSLESMLDQRRDLYSKPYFRLNVYLVGILLGYILYKQLSLDTLVVRKWMKIVINLALWILAGCLCLSVLFGTYKEWHNHQFSDFENTIYLMFASLGWSIGLSLIIHSCHTGYGGMINTFLSWSAWEPLVKMTYGVYLVHFELYYFMFSTFQAGIVCTNILLAVFFVFNTAISYAISSVTAVVVELPIYNLMVLGFKLIGEEPLIV